MKFLKPRDIDGIIEAFEKAGPEGMIIAGGTDLLVKYRDIEIKRSILIDISGVMEIRFIRMEGKVIKIGSATTIREISESQTIERYAPALRTACLLLGSPQIRNRATIGGNIANASPAADTVPPLCVYSALINLKGLDGERSVPIDRFFLGPGRVDLKRNELIESISFEVKPDDSFHHFSKITRRRGPDLSKVSIAMVGRLEKGLFEDVKIAFGAVGPTVVIANKASSLMNGKDRDEVIFEEIARVASEEVHPITDLRSTEDYRREMVRVLTMKALDRWMKERGNDFEGVRRDEI